MFTRRTFLKGCLGAAALLSGAGVFAYHEKVTALLHSVPVLLYHRVGTEKDDLTIPVSRFQADMDFLVSEGYHSLSLDEIKQHVKDPLQGLPEKPVIISFDDGYLDNYTNAFPVLQQHGLKGVFFIITGMMGQQDRMTPDQIREMQAAGMSFGSHTVTHRSLGNLSAAENEQEVTRSKEDLTKVLGKPVDFIAYPCGSYSADTLKVVKAANYVGGFSIHPGFAMFTNRFTIRRIPIFHFDRSLAYVMLRKGLLPDLVG